MQKPNSFLELLYGWLGAPFVLGAWALGVISYFWAIIIALKEWGIVAAFITFCLPVIGQVFWTYRIWVKYSFNHHFVLVNVGCLGCVILSLIFVHQSAKYVER